MFLSPILLLSLEPSLMRLFLCQPIPLNLLHVAESIGLFPVLTLLYLLVTQSHPLGFSLFTWLLGYRAFWFPSILLSGTLIHLCWFLFILLSYPGAPQDKPLNLFFPPVLAIGDLVYSHDFKYHLYTDTSQIYVCLVFLVFLDLSLQLPWSKGAVVLPKLLLLL